LLRIAAEHHQHLEALFQGLELLLGQTGGGGLGRFVKPLQGRQRALELLQFQLFGLAPLLLGAAFIAVVGSDTDIAAPLGVGTKAAIGEGLAAVIMAYRDRALVKGPCLDSGRPPLAVFCAA
jgi:hypothetical protein